MRGTELGLDTDEEVLTLQEAASLVDRDEETIRRWAHEAHVRSWTALRGPGRARIVVHRQDVVDAAKLARKRRQHPDRTAMIPVQLDRVAVLEEIGRRRRLIDEARMTIDRLRGEVEEQHRVIEGHQLAIEELLLGPSVVPYGS